METIYKPASIYHQIQLLFSDGTSSTVLDFSEIQVELRNKKTNNVFATVFKLSDNTVTLTGLDSIYIIINKDVVATMEAGTYEHKVTTEEDDSRFTDSIRTRVGKGDAFILVS